jgi:ubiquinone/menaquinone biosynthesis C-methylase UbiE
VCWPYGAAPPAGAQSPAAVSHHRQNLQVRWNQLARSYDQVAARYQQEFQGELSAKPWDRDLLNAFCASVTDPVVDVGCGPGQVGVYARDRGRHTIGLDLSREMAHRAAAQLDGATVADMRALPVADASVGGLLAFYALIHVRRSELGATLREFRRVLKPGGRILLSAHQGDGEMASDDFLGAAVPFVATLYELDELIAAADGAGLVVAQAERRAPYPSEHPTVRLYLEAVRPR